MNENEESKNILTYICGRLIFNKSTKAIQWRKDILFNKQFWNNWISTGKKSELQPILHITYKNYLKMDHRPKCKTR